MKGSRTVRRLLVAGIVACATGSGCATQDQALAKEVEGLRQEVRALRAEVQELKQAASISEPRTIQLPEAARDEPPDFFLVISILKDGQLALGGDVVTRQELQDRLRDWSAKRPGVRALIMADGGISHKQVVEVMDLAKAAGVKDLAVSTSKK